MGEQHHDDSLTVLLERSEQFIGALLAELEGEGMDSSERVDVSLSLASVSLEHAHSIRVLFFAGCGTSAAGLVRLQFEAVARAMWVMYVASDSAVEKLAAPLSIESEQAAKNLPSINEMLNDIAKQVGTAVPPGAHQMLMTFKNVQLKSLNSFVHGGIHSLRRHSDGFPLPLALQIIQSSNALASMAFMTMAVLTGEAAAIGRINAIVPHFQDCLPDLLPAASGTSGG